MNLLQLFQGIGTMFEQEPKIVIFRIVLIFLGFLLVYLGKKGTLEPLIMIPMGFGMAAVNAGMLFMENNEIGNTMLTSALIFNLINYLKYLVKRTDFVGKENAKFVRGLIRKHLFRVMMANEVTIILKVKLAICLLPDFMLKSFFECYKSCKRRV